MTEEKETSKNFFTPIEAGKTYNLPEPPEEGEEVFFDHYILKCDHIDVQPKSIVLPKFIFNLGMSLKEKGPLLLGFSSDHQNNIFAKIIKASQKGFKKFEILFLDDDNKETISTWTFDGARIQAVDFGFVAKERSAPAEIAIEVDYKSLIIGEVSI